MPPATPTRRLAAILLADVASYTRHVAADDAGTLRRVGTLRSSIAEAVVSNGGRVVDARADDLLAEFGSASSAVLAAIAAQALLAETDAAERSGKPLRFRMGIHIGDVVEEGDRLAGDAVNIAARLASIADPGGICVTQAVVDQVAQRVEARFQRLGKRRLKNVASPVTVHRVQIPGEPPARSGSIAKRAATAAACLAIALAITITALGRPSAVAREEALRSLAPVPSLPAPRTSSIAVLPFANMSSDAGEEYFSDGLTEEIISRLAAIDGLRVAARTSSFAFKGRDMDVRQIGAELGVGSLLEGSVRRDQGQLRVTAQLIQVSDGFHLWAETYERELAAIFAIQSEIAESIATTLEAELAAAPAVQGSTPATDDFFAYELYLRGRRQWVEFQESSVRASIATFEKAIERAPGYAPAWAGLADAYTTLWDRGFDSRPEISERAEAAARRAVALDERLADAHAALAYTLTSQSRGAAARESAMRALALRPGWSRAHVEIGQALVVDGRLAEGLVEMERAAQLDPLSAGVQRQYGRYLMYSGELASALAPLWRAYELNPNDVLTPIWLWETYRRMGDRDAAVESGLLMLPSVLRPMARTAVRLFGAERVLEWTVRSAIFWEPGPCGSNAYGAAFWLAALDEADRMFACLEEASRQKQTSLSIIRVETIFDPYRQDPRFRALLAEFTP